MFKWRFVPLLLLATLARAEEPVLLILGDSLSAAYGMDRNQGWVSLLEHRLHEADLRFEVVNASISGETTRGALSRVDGLLERHAPALVILELGGNDGLRGIPLSEIEANLRALIERIQATGARALLIGIRMPPNYGPVFEERFARLYQDLAQELRVPLVPFLLEGVADRPELMQEDGIHPRAEAQATMLEKVWPVLEPVLRKSRSPRATG